MSEFATVVAQFRATVERGGDRLALVDGDERRTWAELARDVDRTAAGLHARGVEPGAAVALLHGNDRAFLTTFLAIATAGAMAVPLNPRFTPEEIARHLASCDVAGVVAEPALEPGLRAWAAGVNGTPWVEAFTALDHDPVPLASVDPATPALFAFSSGSTGTPKGMVRTQRNLAAEADQFAATVSVGADDVILAVVALFHAHGLGNALLAAVRSGAALALGGLERDAMLATIARERVTVFPAVPFVFHSLAETRRADASELASLRLCISAGAPLAHETYTLFSERFGVPIRQLYGCSEAGSVTINLDADPDTTWGSVGRPMRGIDLAVIGEDGVHRDCDATGEITFRSDALTAGYAGGDEAANAVFAGGWYRTGDVGRIDANGCLSVTGRTTLFISTSGFKVDPFEVEAVLRGHSAVGDAVVVGVAAERGEEVVKAVVVPDPLDVDQGRLRTELLTTCREQLASFKVPRIVEFRDEIPRSPLGKILRKYLV